MRTTASAAVRWTAVTLAIGSVVGWVTRRTTRSPSPSKHRVATAITGEQDSEWEMFDRESAELETARVQRREQWAGEQRRIDPLPPLVTAGRAPTAR